MGIFCHNDLGNTCEAARRKGKEYNLEARKNERGKKEPPI